MWQRIIYILSKAVHVAKYQTHPEQGFFCVLFLPFTGIVVKSGALGLQAEGKKKKYLFSLTFDRTTK